MEKLCCCVLIQNFNQKSFLQYNTVKAGIKKGFAKYWIENQSNILLQNDILSRAFSKTLDILLCIVFVFCFLLCATDII